MKKIKSLIKSISFIGTGLLLSPGAVMAQSWLPDKGFEGDMDSLVKILLNTLIIVAMVVAVVFLIASGFKYMTASGDTTKTEEAQKGIMNALLGLIVCIVAAVMVNFILGRLGVDPENLESMIRTFVV